MKQITALRFMPSRLKNSMNLKPFCKKAADEADEILASERESIEKRLSAEAV